MKLKYCFQHIIIAAMSHKAFIISLIHQDLKHAQIVANLSQKSFPSTQNESLDILDVVADLMRVPKGRMEIYWGRVYMSYLKDAAKLSKAAYPKSLKPLAKNCYNDLDWVMNSGVIL